jgi:tripartite-type tricarboxylate transporter receptor subunit TctC
LICTTAAAKSPADGYALNVSFSNHTTNPAMREKMPYDTIKDFAPLVARAPIVFYANPDVTAQNFKEVLALAKSKPNTLNFGPPVNLKKS